MVTNATIASTVQKLDPGKLIALYELDLTSIGGGYLYFTENSTTSGTTVGLNGVTYIPIDCETEGFEFSGEGQMPRPKFRISNVQQSLVAEINAYEDLIGAPLTRRRTFAKYLDDGAAADSNAQFPIDVWVVERKTAQNRAFIEWELSAYMDVQGTNLPKGQILRDTCLHVYRSFEDPSFDYANATCPYTEEGVGNMFERDGTPTVTSGDDVCGKKYSDCGLRYNAKSDVLPTRAFPSVSKVRVT